MVLTTERSALWYAVGEFLSRPFHPYAHTIVFLQVDEADRTATFWYRRQHYRLRADGSVQQGDGVGGPWIDTADSGELQTSIAASGQINPLALLDKG